VSGHRCDAGEINALDRLVLGHYSPSIRTASDVVLIGMLALPLVIDLVDTRGKGWLADVVVMAEAVIVAQGLTQLVKAAVRRPAPFVYDESVPMDVRANSADATRAFWSGHAAAAFASAAAFTTTFWLRHPDSPWRWGGAGGERCAGHHGGVAEDPRRLSLLDRHHRGRGRRRRQRRGGAAASSALTPPSREQPEQQQGAE